MANPTVRETNNEALLLGGNESVSKTIATNQTIAEGAILGEIKYTVPTTGTAGAGNTGNGTCSGVAGGMDTKIGAYTVTCIDSTTGEGAKTVPATGTAGANTGNGTCTTVQNGGAAKVGTYTVRCITSTTNAGAATVPATGTAGANTGNGTMTGVANGGAAAVGTYTLTCIASTTGAGAKTVPATGTANAGNTGANTMTGVANGGAAKAGTYRMVCFDADVAGSEIFEVIDPDGYHLGNATVAVAYTSGQINFTINDPGANAIVGDSFTVVVTAADGNAGTFRVMNPGGHRLADATVGVAYTSPELNFTINDGAVDYIVGDSFTVTTTATDGNAGVFRVFNPDGYVLGDATVGVHFESSEIHLTLVDGAADFIVGDSFTVAVTAADANGGTFKVIDPDGQRLGDASVGVAFNSSQINLTLNDGAIDFAVGDYFTITVAAGSRQLKVHVSTNVDGSQFPMFVAHKAITTAGSTATCDVTRSGDVDASKLDFGGADTINTVINGETIGELLRKQGINAITLSSLTALDNN